MHASFTEFLNSNFGGGTMIAIIAALCSFILSAIVAVVKWYNVLRKKFDDEVEKRVHDERENMEALQQEQAKEAATQESINNLCNTVEQLSSKIEKITESVESLQTKMDISISSLEKTNKKEDNAITKLQENIENLSNSLNEIQKDTELLKDSDKDDIKAFITREYNYWYPKKCIDIYSLKAIESRYDKYLKENGNTFVKDLMTRIRTIDVYVPNTYQEDPNDDFISMAQTRKIVRLSNDEVELNTGHCGC